MRTFPTNFHCPICQSDNIHLWGSATDIGNANLIHKIAICHKCTHIFVIPLPSIEFLADAYKTNNTSVLSDDGFFESRSTGPFSEGDRWVLKHVKKNAAPGNLLDIGSANPRLIATIKELGWEISIVEPSQNIERMSNFTDVKIYHSLFEDCAFQNNFEIVSAIDVLEHVHSPINFLKKIKSILSVNGNCLLRFPNSYSLKCKLEHDKWNMIRPLGHLHFFSPRSFQAACKNCHLKITTLRSHDLNNYCSLVVAGETIRGMRFLSPLKFLFDRLLFGDQILATVSHE